jgi:APA family basic amino acid/polyamine antiporter
MTSGLFAKKSVDRLMQEASTEDNQGLQRTLGAANLTALGVGAIIGAGIFVLTGTAAAQYAGPAIAISFAISGIGCAFAGLCYAEFASMIPMAGSAYTYAYATLGELVAWIIGWDLILEYLFGASTVAVGWSEYLVNFLKDLGITFPATLSNAPFNLPAMLIIALITTLLVVGIRESAGFNNAIVFVKVCIIILFIGFGFSHINPQNLTPFIPQNTGKFGEYGWSGILRGSSVIFFSYIGFDAVSTTAQEARNPQKDMPIGILGSLIISTILYIAVSLVLTGIVPYKELNVAAPIALGIEKAGPALHWLRLLVDIGAIAGLSSVILVMLLGQPRIFYAMAKDGLLPPRFAAIHPRFRTPATTTIVTGIAALIFAGLFPISELSTLVNIGTLLAFFIVCTAVPVLRQTRPDLPRPFKTPLVPLVPILGAVTSLAQIAALPRVTWLRLLVWLVIGLIIYFAYGRKHSTVQLQRAEQRDYQES